MKIGIIGVGAMGSVYAGLFAAAGHDVWGVDTWAAHVDAINRAGLRITGASGDNTSAIHATTDPGTVGPCDLVVIATKVADVAQAAHAASRMRNADTPVLTIQNGLGAIDALSRTIPAAHVLIGVAGGFGASIKAPGHAHHNGMELVRLGEHSGGRSDRLEQLAMLWQEAGFKAQCYDNIEQLVWEKFICNVSFSGPCTVLGKTVGEVLEDPHAWLVARGCGLEAFQVGRARGVAFSFNDAAEYIRDFGSRIPGAEPSMLQDHRAARRSEIDHINGMVPTLAAEIGLSAPVNETIAALVRALEAGFGADREKPVVTRP